MFITKRSLLFPKITQSQLKPAIYQPEDSRLDTEAQGDRKGPSPQGRGSTALIAPHKLLRKEKRAL